MTEPDRRPRVRVASKRLYGVLLHYWHCPSCHWVSRGCPSWLVVGTHAHRHALECRDAS